MVGNPPRSEPAPRTRPVNWRQEYLHLTVILMNVCWIAPWITLIVGQFVDLSLNTVLEISTPHLLASLLFVRWALHRRIRSDRIEIGVILLMALTAGLTVLSAPSWIHAHDHSGSLELADLFRTGSRTNGAPAALLIVIWTLYLWWRSYRLSSGYITLVRASFGLRLGIVALLWALIFANAHLREETLSLVPIFFFFGLLSSSLARANNLHLDRAGHGSALGRGWMISLFGITIIITLGGYAAALWLAGIDMGLVAAVLGIVARVLLSLVFLLLTPVLLAVSLVYDFILTLLPHRGANTAAETAASGVKASHQSVAHWLSTLAEVSSIVLLATVILIILVALIALIWFLLLTRERPDEYQAEEHESIGTGAVVGGLRQALLDNWQRLASMLGVLRQTGARTVRRAHHPAHLCADGKAGGHAGLSPDALRDALRIPAPTAPGVPGPPRGYSAHHRSLRRRALWRNPRRPRRTGARARSVAAAGA
jgi:hypothetical protein